MIVSSRLLSYKMWRKLIFVKALGKESKAFSTVAQTKQQTVDKNESQQLANEKSSDSMSFANYRFLYPEFLPDPNPLYRNSMREKLERMDMLARRSVLNIPEFYVGSILAVTYSEPHAIGKVNRFVGICILREGTGLRAAFILRNAINGEGIEVRYDLYDPAIQKVDCLRLEKRLDDQLLYLRDAPIEYSTFPFDMKPEPISGTVPVNKLQVPLNPQPWLEKWERKNMKGIRDIIVNEKRQKKAAAAAKPWEKYDLMKIYRETIPEEEQMEIFSDVYTDLRHLEVQKSVLKRKRILEKPKRTV
ncbi:mitochondrial ribosomal protein L19 [Xylocopa sonorina]|uniref:mitochondrial ribosomal protein L19 n=1 Tax=Xylocopa sonorina TaxID=1818115 RepID=UPI00403ACB5E